MKYFEVKLYDASGNFKKQMNPRNITSQITFSENINGTQGNLNISIKDDSDDYSVTDIIEVREIVKWETWVNETYTGIIERTTIDERTEWELIILDCFWIGTALNDIYYQNGSLKHEVTDTPWNIAIDIIDSFNSIYGSLVGETQNLWTSLFWYDAGSIDVTWTSLHFEFDKINCFKALQRLCEDTGFYFFIEPSWKVVFQKTTTPKILTFRREIISIQRKIKKDELVNKYYLERSGGTYNTYQDTTSQTNYKIKELYEAKTEIKNSTTQDEVGDEKILEYKNPRQETQINILAQKTPFLFPWMSITTQNTKNRLENVQVTKIQKNLDTWTLYIWDFTSFWKSISKK